MYTWMLFKVKGRSGIYERLEIVDSKDDTTIPPEFLEKCLHDPINYYISVQEYRPSLVQKDCGEDPVLDINGDVS